MSSDAFQWSEWLLSNKRQNYSFILVDFFPELCDWIHWKDQNCNHNLNIFCKLLIVFLEVQLNDCADTMLLWNVFDNSNKFCLFWKHLATLIGLANESVSLSMKFKWRLIISFDSVRSIIIVVTFTAIINNSRWKFSVFISLRFVHRPHERKCLLFKLLSPSLQIDVNTL